MPTTDKNTPIIRETYEEYAVGSSRVSTISDPANTRAWIRSTLTLPIER